MQNLLEELTIEMNKINALKEDYEKKNELCGQSNFNDGAIIALENAVNHIKRAIARAKYPDKVEALQVWIGVLCEAYKCNNKIVYDAIAEQVVYEMFLGASVDTPYS